MGQKGSSEKKHVAPTPSDLQLTTGEGLPEGWAMQVMSSGRTLFIDMGNQDTTFIDPRTGKVSDIKVNVFNINKVLTYIPKYQNYF